MVARWRFNARDALAAPSQRRKPLRFHRSPSKEKPGGDVPQRKRRADPGLIGMTGDAALGAVSVNALGRWLLDDVLLAPRPWLMPLADLVSASVVTAFVFGLAQATHANIRRTEGAPLFQSGRLRRDAPATSTDRGEPMLDHPTHQRLRALKLDGMAFVGRSFHWKAR